MFRRRRRLAGALVALLLAGCAGGGGPSPTGAGQSSTSISPQPLSAPPSAPLSPPPPSSVAPAPSPPTTSVRRTAPTAPPVAPAPETFAGARRTPGAFAAVLLGPKPASRLVLEVLRQPGSQPGQNTVAHLAQVLQDSSGKPVSVVVGLLPEGGGPWTPDDIRALADRPGATPQSPDQAVIRLLFLRGQLQGEDTALGATVRGDTAAVFTEQVRSSAAPLVGAAAIEAAVATHELGHLLGLVDLVRRTGRGDPEHPGHSANRASVMYWAIESDLVASVLVGPPPTEFDAADRTDLAAIRSGS